MIRFEKSWPQEAQLLLRDITFAMTKLRLRFVFHPESAMWIRFALLVGATIEASLIFGSDFRTECPCLMAFGDPLREVSAADTDACWTFCNAYTGCVAFSYCVSHILILFVWVSESETFHFRLVPKNAPYSVRARLATEEMLLVSGIALGILRRLRHPPRSGSGFTLTKGRQLLTVRVSSPQIHQVSAF